jgi:hypothetical protein
MLNPSTADESADDPTIRRCIGFARGWGYGGLEVVNLFALRATDPRELRRSSDPIGLSNDAYLRDAAARAGAMVIAWGAHGVFRSRGAAALELLSPRARLLALGWTNGGEPRHPLYLRRDVMPIVVGSGRRSAA